MRLKILGKIRKLVRRVYLGEKLEKNLPFYSIYNKLFVIKVKNLLKLLCNKNDF